MHHPHNAFRVSSAFVSVNALKNRKSSFSVGDWVMDSGAFTTILKRGEYHDAPDVYAAQIRRWAANGNLLAAVSQDYMCEGFILEKWGRTVADHQRKTIERYDALLKCDVGGVYIMPSLQGYDPAEYVSHLEQYGDRLAFGQWVGVGSVCKRNANAASIEAVLGAIKRVRPDLRLHGFGLKISALRSANVCDLLHTADSMAWSFAARKEGRNPNDWREAVRFEERVKCLPAQTSLFGAAATESEA